MSNRSKKIKRAKLISGTVLMVLFLLLIAALKIIDVQPIGPQGSEVGFATLNGAFHRLTGVNMTWYDITGALGMAAIAVACGFGLFGLWQLIKRRSLKRVDRDIYALAGLYIAIGIVYVLFEKAVVNYRPIDMGAGLEPSFPSSHTMLTCCIMSSAIWQFKRRIKSEALRKTTVMLCTAVMAVTIAGRLVSGVHWITDIAGGILISASLMAFYRAAAVR